MSSGTKRARSGIAETATVIFEALLIALFVRVFFYQPFNIPSGSMKDTLLIGDYLFVSKLSYGYSKYSFPFSPNLFSGRVFGAEPKRGDVIVFKKPPQNEIDYIKRVIGLPGDEVQMIKGVLYINGKAVPKEPDGEFDNIECYERSERKSSCQQVHYKKFKETLPEGRTYPVLDLADDRYLDNTIVFKVPAGHYFVMGDNRDNSSDSRVQDETGVGYVPLENIIGRAEIIFFSAAVDEPGALRLTSPWTWPFDIRWKRFLNLVR